MNNKDYVIVKDGEMVHFKYIKREKVNGEWRYYYDKGSIGRSIKKAVGIDARNAYRSARDAAVAAEKTAAETRAIADKSDKYSQGVKTFDADIAYEQAAATAAQARNAARVSAAIAGHVKSNIPQKPVSDQELNRLKNHRVQTAEAVVTAKKELAAAQKASQDNTGNKPINSLSPNVTATTFGGGATNTAAVDAAKKKLANAEKAAEQARAAYNEALNNRKKSTTQDDYDDAMDAYNGSVNAANEALRKAKEATRKEAEAAKTATAERRKLDQATKDLRAATDAHYKSEEAVRKAKYALEEYYKTPLGSLKFLSDKGKELLYKIF